MARAWVVRYECEPLALLELRLGPRADLAHHRHEVDVHAWLGLRLGCRVQGAGCRVQGAGCRVQGAGFEVDVHAQHADEPLRLARRATLRRAQVLVAHVMARVGQEGCVVAEGRQQRARAAAHLRE